jgi:hypothetical protein
VPEMPRWEHRFPASGHHAGLQGCGLCVSSEKPRVLVLISAWGLFIFVLVQSPADPRRP